MLRVARLTVIVCVLLGVIWTTGCGRRAAQQSNTDESPKALVNRLVNSRSDIAIALTNSAKLMKVSPAELKPFIPELEKAWKVEPNRAVKKEIKKVLDRAKQK